MSGNNDTSHHSSLERQEVVECDNCLFEQCTKFSASLASTSSDCTQSTNRKRRNRGKNTPQASDEQLSFQLGSMGAAFFKCERKVLLSFAILSVDLELGLIAHQASTVRGGRTDQRQKQGCSSRIIRWTTKKTIKQAVAILTPLFSFTSTNGAS